MKEPAKHREYSFLLTGVLAVMFITSCATEKDQAKSNHIKVVRDDQAITIQAEGKNILRYQTAVCDVPSGVDPLFRRGAFIHPLWSPSGQVLTQIQPPDHYHHYGIWNPWTKVLVEGKEVDFWNLKEGQGTVRFAGIDYLRSGSSQGAFKVRQDHVQLSKDKSPRTVMKETLDVSAGDEQVQGRQVWVVDMVSTLTNVLDSPVVLEQYRYGGGIGFRATKEWTKENCTILTSEGKTRQEADGTRARWCIVSGAAGEKGRSGILFLSHPDNYEYPEPMRVWPENINPAGEVFFEFCPIRLTAWTLEPHMKYQLKYRMVVYDGAIDSETAESLWKNYTVRNESKK
jgi:hypothetical protein